MKVAIRERELHPIGLRKQHTGGLASGLHVEGATYITADTLPGVISKGCQEQPGATPDV
jgi:hypothetical protein